MKLTILVEYCIILIEGGFDEMSCKTEIIFLHGMYMPSNGGHIIREENKIMKKVKCNELCNNSLQEVGFT